MLYADCTMNCDSLTGCLVIVTTLMHVTEVTNCYNIFASLNGDELMSLNYCVRCILMKHVV